MVQVIHAPDGVDYPIEEVPSVGVVTARLPTVARVARAKPSKEHLNYLRQLAGKELPITTKGSSFEQ